MEFKRQPQREEKKANHQRVTNRGSSHVVRSESHAEVSQPHSITADEELRCERELVLRDFQAFCRRAGYETTPPLPTDAARLFEAFVSAHGPDEVTQVHTRALDSVRGDYANALQAIEHKLEAMRAKLSSRSAIWSSGKNAFLKYVKVSTALPTMSVEMRPQIERSARFLAESWSPRLGLTEQGVLSVYQDNRNQTTIVQIGIGGVGSIFLTIPQVLDPLEVARQMLQAMQGVFHTALGDADPIAVVNGAFPQLNMKELLPNAVILRSRSGDTAAMRERIQSLYERRPLSPENTRIVSALPISQAHMPAISLQAEDWDLWRRVYPEWANSTSTNGFSLAPSITATSFLDALQTEENVIVLVAHAETNSLYFPEPMPDGSQVRPEDIQRLTERIRKNRPVVYLFCCETAKYSGIESISQTLLDAGVAAVVAPQGILGADRQTRRLFEHFLDYGSEGIPVKALRDAERESGQREMETWLG